MASLIYKKVEDGMIDVTNECSGVRSGTGVPVGTKETKTPVSLTPSIKRKEDSCGC